MHKTLDNFYIKPVETILELLCIACMIKCVRTLKFLSLFIYKLRLHLRHSTRFSISHSQLMFLHTAAVFFSEKPQRVETSVEPFPFRFLQFEILKVLISIVETYIYIYIYHMSRTLKENTPCLICHWVYSSCLQAHVWSLDRLSKIHPPVRIYLFVNIGTHLFTTFPKGS